MIKIKYLFNFFSLLKNNIFTTAIFIFILYISILFFKFLLLLQICSSNSFLNILGPQNGHFSTAKSALFYAEAMSTRTHGFHKYFAHTLSTFFALETTHMWMHRNSCDLPEACVLLWVVYLCKCVFAYLCIWHITLSYLMSLISSFSLFQGHNCLQP